MPPNAGQFFGNKEFVKMFPWRLFLLFHLEGVCKLKQC